MAEVPNQPYPIASQPLQRLGARPALTRRTLALAMVSCGALPACVDTAQQSAMEVGEKLVIEGRVASLDLRPMQVDGDGIIILETGDRRRISVFVAAHEQQCEARGLEVLSTLRPGEHVRVKGTAFRSNDISVCETDTYLERIR